MVGEVRGEVKISAPEIQNARLLSCCTMSWLILSRHCLSWETLCPGIFKLERDC